MGIKSEFFHTSFKSLSMGTVGAFVKSAAQSTSDLGGGITVVPRKLVIDKLEIRYVPEPIVLESSSDIIGFIRIMEHTDVFDLEGTLVAITPKDLYGKIRVFWQKFLPAYIGARHTADLTGTLYPIPPVDLEGHIVPYTTKDLLSYIAVVRPQDLRGFIRTQATSYADLLGVITPHGGWSALEGTLNVIYSTDLIGSISTWSVATLNGLISLLSSHPPVDLLGTISISHQKGFKGIIVGRLEDYVHRDISFTLKAFFQGDSSIHASIRSVDNSLSSSVNGLISPIEPVELEGYIGLNFPSPLYGFINIYNRGKVYDRVQLNYGPAKDLLGLVNATGGFTSVRGNIVPTYSVVEQFLGTIQCYDTLSLQGLIDMSYLAYLDALIGTKSLRDSVKNLEAKLKATFASSLLATIATNENKKDLLASIAPDGASASLFASLIVDKVYYSDVISINTAPFADLGGLIFSTNTCSFSSGFKGLSSFIRTFQPSKATVSEAITALTKNVTTGSSNAYPGGVFTGGTYSAIEPITYTVSIDTSIGNTMDSGVRFSVTSTGAVDNSSSYTYIEATDVDYPVGSLGITIAFGSFLSPFGQDDSWDIEVSATPGVLYGYIAFRPFMEVLPAVINAGTSFADSSNLLASISTKGAFSDLQAYIETNSRSLRGIIVPQVPASTNLEAAIGTLGWNVYLRGDITAKLVLPRVVPYTDSFEYVTNTMPKVIKQVKVSFSKKGEQYIYSQLLGNTFLLDGNLWGVELSLIEEEKLVEAGLFGSRKKVKKKLMFDISPFDSFDEAMRYFANFIAYGATSTFESLICPTGGFSPLKGYLTIQDINKLKDLNARLLIVDLDKVTVQGLIDVAGSFSPFRSTIKAIGSSTQSLEATVHSTNLLNLSGLITPS